MSMRGPAQGFQRTTVNTTLRTATRNGILQNPRVASSGRTLLQDMNGNPPATKVISFPRHLLLLSQPLPPFSE